MPHDFRQPLRPPAGQPAGAATWADARQRTDPCEEDCTPRCPACGGLKCLCRPRFFAGQLLTDQDLTRLQQYVIDKNRLHNRYLHGWGVACGLEVTCDACDSGHVVVSTGYAVAPCGDDIVVCNDQSVDLCGLISACAPSRNPVCDSPYDVPPQDCSGRSRRWVLAICYDERPVRGVTAQLGMGDTACGKRCGCGGAGACSCGGSGSCGCGNGAGGTAGGCSCGATAATTGTAKKRAANPQCEATQVCEGYRFIAYPAPAVPAVPEIDPNGGGAGQFWAWIHANRARFGPLLERVLCCVTRAMQLRTEIVAGKPLDTPAALAILTDYAAALAELAADFARHRCAFATRVERLLDEARAFADQVGDADVLTPAQQAELRSRVDALDGVWYDIVSECFCSALLPACPAPAPDNCVPLAVVTVAGSTCRVAEVCNWEGRKLLMTWRTAMYWLSWLPWGLLRKWIAGLCCGDERGRTVYTLLLLTLGTAFTGLKAGFETAAPTARATRSGGGGAGTGTGGDALAEALAAPDMLGHMLKDFDRLRAEGASAGQPGWAALAARMADGSALGMLAGGAGGADLARQVDTLQQQLAAQQKQIDALLQRHEAAPAQPKKTPPRRQK